MEVILCDDNINSVMALERYVSQYGKRNNKHFTILKYSSGLDLLRSYAWKPRQLIFMDMKMDSLNGNEVVHQLQKYTNKEPQVVFISGHHSEFWQFGYRLHAFHFLTKPINAKDIDEVLDDYILNRLKEPIKTNCFQFKRTSAADWEMINEQQIIYFEKISTTNTIRMMTQHGSIILYETLKNISDRTSSEFVQCHKGYIVNVRHIKRRERNKFIMELRDAGGHDVILDIGKAYGKEAIRQYVAFNQNGCK